MKNKQYVAVPIGSDEYVVIDIHSEMEICVVNSYEGEAETAGVRAGRIAAALNKVGE